MRSVIILVHASSFGIKEKKNQNMIIFQGQKLNMYQYFVVIFKFYESNFNKKKSM